MDQLVKLLSGNTYPGRGIVLGASADGEAVRIAYFIMGRSANSRNRIFVMSDERTLETRAADPSKMQDPSLIIYAPFRRLADGTLIVTNGDQTDTVRDALVSGRTFRDALMTRAFEPDAPNYTPRISGLITFGKGKPAFELAILKSLDGAPETVVRSFFTYDSLPAGTGLFLHTYRGDGSPIPSFEGEPERVDITGSFEDWTDSIWENLNESNKISLFTCEASPDGTRIRTRLINKYEAVS